MSNTYTQEGETFTREKALRLIWKHTHRDFRGNMNGERTILTYRNGTCLVMLFDLTEDEINEKLALSVRLERIARDKKLNSTKPSTGQPT